MRSCPPCGLISDSSTSVNIKTSGLAETSEETACNCALSGSYFLGPRQRFSGKRWAGPESSAGSTRNASQDAGSSGVKQLHSFCDSYMERSPLILKTYKQQLIRLEDKRVFKVYLSRSLPTWGAPHCCPGHKHCRPHPDPPPSGHLQRI